MLDHVGDGLRGYGTRLLVMLGFLLALFLLALPGAVWAPQSLA
jgi:hypothetical protein